MKVRAKKRVSYQAFTLEAGSVEDISQELYSKISDDVELLENDEPKEAVTEPVETQEDFKEEISNKKLKNIKKK